MLSFGLAVAGTFDGASFEPAALAVSGLDRDRLIREGLAPAEAMAAPPPGSVRSPASGAP
jgi:hypothetical protein